MKDYCAIARKYASDITRGKIPACRYVRLACERQQRDLRRQRTDKAWPYRFVKERAEAICEFIEMLQHIKGEWAGERIVLEPWQVFILTTVFGWVNKNNGCRRFRTGYEEVARKNAKSTKTAGIGNYLAFADGEGGAEVYSAATTRDQAAIVFGDAQNMCRRDGEMREALGIEVFSRSISQVSTASKFEPLSSEGDTLDGLNVHGALIDELHAHKTREVFDVLETATGARRQSLLWLITTAGSNRTGICYEQRSYVIKILEQTVDDDSYFGIIYTLDEHDDWQDPKNWIKANPNLGVSVKLEDMERLFKKAVEMPSAQNNFLTKRLNIWVNADVAWMNMAKWRECEDPSLTMAQFIGRSCVVAVDLATKIDIAAVKYTFKVDVEGQPHYYEFNRFYIPEEAVKNSLNENYDHWAKAGYLTVTPGNVIDFGQIEDDIIEARSMFEISEIAYDPFQATQFAINMAGEGFKMVEYPQTTKTMSEPMYELEALVMDKRYHHNGNPVMTWMASNVVAHVNAKDQIFPRKEMPGNKIDGMVAAIMAIGRLMNEQDTTSVYSSREPMFLS